MELQEFKRELLKTKNIQNLVDLELPSRPIHEKVRKLRKPWHVFGKDILVATGNTWIVDETYFNLKEKKEESFWKTLQCNLYAHFAEGIGLLEHEGETLGYYLERMQLIPYNWGEKLPIMPNTYELKEALKVVGKKVPSIHFRPDRRYLECYRDINKMNPYEITQKLGSLFKYETLEIHVNEDKFYEVITK